MSRLPELPGAIERIPGVARARVDWPEVDGPAVLDIALDPGQDRREAVGEILAALRDVAGVDLGSLETAPPALPGPPASRRAAEDRDPAQRQDAERRDQGPTAADGTSHSPARSRAREPAARSALEGGPPDAARGSQPHPAEPGERDRRRPAFHELRVERSGAGVRVEVGLRWLGRAVTGTATSRATDHASLQAVAEATVDALADLLPADVVVHVDHVEPAPLGGESMVSVGAAIVGARDEQRVLGSALVRGDRWDAAVRASLDALNRQLGRPRPPEGDDPAPAAGDVG